ncbi:MAG: hypothetical protein HC802_20590 [Caldilineaceae bacterium]|nr:hypothetical protein [Caldilineaceae bacterium]
MLALDSTDPAPTLSKAAYKHVVRQQLDRLNDLAALVFLSKISVIIVFEGWDAAGKGSNIRLLTERLDHVGLRCFPPRRPAPTSGCGLGSGAFGCRSRGGGKSRSSTAAGMVESLSSG